MDIVTCVISRNRARTERSWRPFVSGYEAVVWLLGLTAGGSAIYAAVVGGSGPMAIAFAGLAVFTLLLSRVLWVIGRPAGPQRGDGAGGGGDGGVSRQGPGPSGADGEFVDWQRFERDFRAYVLSLESAGGAART